MGTRMHPKGSQGYPKGPPKALKWHQHVTLGDPWRALWNRPPTRGANYPIRVPFWGQFRSPFGSLWAYFSLKNELRNRARFPTRFVNIFGAIRGGPTRNPLQPARSKRMSTLFWKNTFLNRFCPILSSKMAPKWRPGPLKDTPRNHTKKTHQKGTEINLS